MPNGKNRILYVYHPDSRPTGDAFILFANEADTVKDLKKHCKESIGLRYIELYKSTRVEVTQVGGPGRREGGGGEGGIGGTGGKSQI